MKRFIYIFYFLWYINTISTSSIINQNNLHSNYDDLVAIITYKDKVAILNSKEIKVFNQTPFNDGSFNRLISQIDITIGPYERKISEFKFLTNDYISYCVACKKCVICSIRKKKNCSVILIKKSKCTSITLSWDGDKESNIFLRRTNSEINFRGNLNHIISYKPDKLFIDYSNDYILSEIGSSNDFDLSINQEVIYSFSYKNYTYFLGYHNRRKDLEKIYDHKQYEKFFEGNVSIAKLIRVCSKDNSKDIITRMDITLTCNDFDINNSFLTTGAFLIEDNGKLLVSFKSTNNNKNQLCSYNLNDVNNRFNEYWDICQVNNIDTTTMCDEINLTSYKKDYEVCSILSRSGSRHSDVICTKFGQQPERISNCDAGNNEYSKVILGRHGWLDCYYPFDGTFEASFNSSLLSTNLHYSKRSKMLFFSDNHGNGELFYPIDKKKLKLIKKLSSIFKVKYPFTLSYDTDDFYNLDEEKEMNIEILNCSNIYKTCNDINTAEMGELKCKWCALENGKQMSINIEKEKCGDNLNKGWIFNKEDKCPFKIKNLKCGNNTITIMDNSFNKRTKFSACNVKINCNIINTTTTCFIPQDLKDCPFKIEEMIDKKNTFYQYIHECSNNYKNSHLYDVSPESKKSRTFKWIISSIIIFLFVLLLIILIYLKYHCAKRLESLNVIASDNLNNQRAKNSYTLSEMQIDKNGYVSPTISRNLFGDMPIEYIIQPNEYEINEFIGSGNFGLIYSGILKKCYSGLNETVAFKELKKNDSNWTVWKREIIVLTECKHPNIVEFKGMTYDIKKGYIMVMEFMKKGDLKKYLMDTSNQVTSFNIIRWALNIIDAMIYLHDKDFTHRDLSCRNILLTEMLEAKLSDFGLSRQLNNNGLYIGDKNYPVQLPLQWTAPECFTGKDEYTFSRANDIWAFSVVIWEMFTRKYCPYPNTPFDEYKRICLTEPLPFGLLEYNNINDWIQLTSDCRNLEPQNRPTFIKIKEIVTEIANKTIQGELIIKM
ncbi:Tyrosine-protein kinase Abl [Strongyloides ratti]|uniref:Tyrosine-protein kinase Abl n=1 Tax=Strongyloides ratti TaxID=34506 RepID=A0A090KPK5_STRRB|nr:Tyrosine-protein kinase Abl [Strongyloides ratti]CEF59508.1 Tyrosine-protein kinase Abl [Strongyloides ratti]